MKNKVKSLIFVFICVLLHQSIAINTINITPAGRLLWQNSVTTIDTTYPLACNPPTPPDNQVLACVGSTFPSTTNVPAASSGYFYELVSQPSGANAAINLIGNITGITVSGTYTFALVSDFDTSCKSTFTVTAPSFCLVLCPQPNCGQISVKKI